MVHETRLFALNRNWDLIQLILLKQLWLKHCVRMFNVKFRIFNILIKNFCFYNNFIPSDLNNRIAN